LAQNAVGQFLAIARILRPQGRKGEVAAEILTDFPARFQQLPSVFLEVSGQAPQPVGLERAWPHKGRIILKFSGIDSIESAARLRGRQVLIPWEQRTPLPRTITTSASCTVAASFGKARGGKSGRWSRSKPRAAWMCSMSDARMEKVKSSFPSRRKSARASIRPREPSPSTRRRSCWN